MVVSRKARFGGVKFQWACSLTYGLLLRAFHLAGPDGIRGRRTCLHIGLDALLTSPTATQRAPLMATQSAPPGHRVTRWLTPD